MLDFKKIIVIFYLMGLLSFNIGNANTLRDSFVGTWCWDKDSNYSTFSIKIKKNKNMYVGDYFAVAYGGDRIDDKEKAFSFKLKGGSVVKTKILTGVRMKMGLVRLEVLNKKLKWTVLKEPNGEFYVPKKAFLHKCKG